MDKSYRQNWFVQYVLRLCGVHGYEELMRSRKGLHLFRGGLFRRGLFRGGLRLRLAPGSLLRRCLRRSLTTKVLGKL